MSKTVTTKTPLQSTASAGKYMLLAGALSYIEIYLLSKIDPNVYADAQLISAISVVLMTFNNSCLVYLNKKFKIVV